jgi:hypothetical protein
MREFVVNPTDSRLGGFEERLLTQLKEEITEVAAPALPARRRLVPVLAAAAGLVAVAVGAAAAIGVFSSPAYAVDREPDGSIRISIREYTDPKGLERKLNGFGVSAVIDYVPSGMRCKEPRARYAPDEPDLLSADDTTRSDEQAAWLLHPEKIGPGQTLVYTVWLYDDGTNSSTVGRWRLAIGAVAPCELQSGGPQVGAGSVSAGD